MAEEELKQEAEVEELNTEVVNEEEQSAEDVEKQKKAALAAFIMSLVGFELAFFWAFGTLIGFLGGIAAIILGALAMKKAKLAVGVETQPHKTFAKLGKIFGIISLILGILAVVLTVVITVIVLFIAGTALLLWAIVIISEVVQTAMNSATVLLPLLAL